MPPEAKTEKAVAAPEDAPAPAPVAPAEKAEEKKYPAKLQLEVLYGYFDENNRYRQWAEGDVVTDAAEIKLLVDRAVPVKAVA